MYNSDRSGSLRDSSSEKLRKAAQRIRESTGVLRDAESQHSKRDGESGGKPPADGSDRRRTA